MTGGEPNFSSRHFSEQDIFEKLKYQKATIDSLFNHNKDKLLIFVKLADKDELEQITNGKFPENVETTFNILKDSFGKVITVSEFPFSESGDWNIILTLYFDKDGKTFAFERQTNFFNSICTDGFLENYPTGVNPLYKLVKVIVNKSPQWALRKL